jgi:hypothetical protein
MPWKALSLSFIEIQKTVMRAAEQEVIVLRVTRRSAFQMLGNIGPAQSASNNELSALSASWAGGTNLRMAESKSV